MSQVDLETLVTILERHHVEEDQCAADEVGATVQVARATARLIEAREETNRCRQEVKAFDDRRRGAEVARSSALDLSRGATFRQRLAAEVEVAAEAVTEVEAVVDRALQLRRAARTALAKSSARRVATEGQLERARLLVARQVADRADEDAAEVAVAIARREEESW